MRFRQLHSPNHTFNHSYSHQTAFTLKASLVFLTMAFGHLVCAGTVTGLESDSQTSNPTVLFNPSMDDNDSDNSLEKLKKLGFVQKETNKIVIQPAQNQTGSFVGVDFSGNDWTSPECYDLEIQLSPDRFGDTIGIQTHATEDVLAYVMFYRNVSVHAQTALKGNGTINFVNSSSDEDSAERLHAQISGNIDMNEGAISNSGYDVNYRGQGTLGRYMSDEQTSILTLDKDSQSLRTTLLRVTDLVMTAGQISVQGTIAENVGLMTASVLMFQNIRNQDLEMMQADDTVGAPQTSNISVKQTGTLVMGTLMDGKFDDIDKLYPNFETLSDEQKSLARLNQVLASAYIAVDNPKSATLVLASDFTTDQLPETISVTVGSVTNATTSGIAVGSDAQVVYYVDDVMREGTNFKPLSANDSDKIVLNGEGDAQFILYGWDGKSDVNVALNGFKADNIFSLGGVRAKYDMQTGTISRLWCYQFAGLKSRETVRFVEEIDDVSTIKALPGYAFIVDSFTEDRVGRNVYANVMDAALFMPATDGLAASFERAQATTMTNVLFRDINLFEDLGHWWAAGWYENREMPELYSGGSGNWGFDSDVATGVLGYDFELAQNWIGGFAVYAGSIDTESRGLVQRTSGDMSFVGALLSATYLNQDLGQFRFGISFARAQGDSKQIVNGHRLTTEPEVDMATAAVGWQHDWTSDCWHFVPKVQLGVNWAQLKGTEIKDNNENVSGTGFKTSSDTRVWADVTVGGDIEARFKFYDFDVAPRIGAQVTKTFGQTDWEIESSLFDNKAHSRATFESARSYAAKVSAGLTVAGSGYTPEMSGGLFGYGAKPTGKSLPYAWSLSVDGAYEWSGDSERAAFVGLHFKQLF